MIGRWHVHFDTDFDTVVAHICDLHRTLGLNIGCDDQRPDGDCDHVQIRLCMCRQYLPCAACARHEVSA